MCCRERTGSFDREKASYRTCGGFHRKKCQKIWIVATWSCLAIPKSRQSIHHRCIFTHLPSSRSDNQLNCAYTGLYTATWVSAHPDATPLFILMQFCRTAIKQLANQEQMWKKASSAGKIQTRYRGYDCGFNCWDCWEWLSHNKTEPFNATVPVWSPGLIKPIGILIITCKWGDPIQLKRCTSTHWKQWKVPMFLCPILPSSTDVQPLVSIVIKNTETHKRLYTAWVLFSHQLAEAWFMTVTCWNSQQGSGLVS